MLSLFAFSACDTSNGNQSSMPVISAQEALPSSVYELHGTEEYLLEHGSALYHALQRIYTLGFTGQQEAAHTSISEVDAAYSLDKPSKVSEAAAYAATYRRQARWVFPASTRKARAAIGLSPVTAWRRGKSWSAMTTSSAGDWPQPQFTAASHAPSSGNFTTYSRAAGVKREEPIGSSDPNGTASTAATSVMTPADTPERIQGVLPRLGSFLLKESALGWVNGDLVDSDGSLVNKEMRLAERNDSFEREVEGSW